MPLLLELALVTGLLLAVAPLLLVPELVATAARERLGLMVLVLLLVLLPVGVLLRPRLRL